jgi:membrane protein YqaA with SNARE-associated domain
MDAIARFARGRRAVLLVAGWAFGEAIVLPVVPDVALDLIALAAPRRALRLFLVAVGAALIGSVLLYAFASTTPDAARRLVLAVPGIDQPMLDAAAATVTGGVPWSIAQVGPGTPLKVDTLAWAVGPATLPAFLLGVVLNRVSRILPVLLLAAAAGAIAPDWIRRHERLVVAGYVIAWLVLYVTYFAGIV